MKRTGCVRTIASLVFAGCVAAATAAEAEVCQLITYKFHPNMTDEAVHTFATTLLPLYRDAPRSVERLRVFREVASPTPLDLIVMGCFTGMATLDETNQQLADRARVKGINLRGTFERLAEMSVQQTSEFVDLLSSPSFRPEIPDGFHVFEYVRLLRSGDRVVFERNMFSGAPRRGGLMSVETARVLVSDGWDFLRIVGVENLTVYQDYEASTRNGRLQSEGVVASRKTLIMPEDYTLSVP